MIIEITHYKKVWPTCDPPCPDPGHCDNSSYPEMPPFRITRVLPWWQTYCIARPLVMMCVPAISTSGDPCWPLLVQLMLCVPDIRWWPLVMHLHLILLTILGRFSWPSLADMWTKVAHSSVEIYHKLSVIVPYIRRAPDKEVVLLQMFLRLVPFNAVNHSFWHRQEPHQKDNRVK